MNSVSKIFNAVRGFFIMVGNVKKFNLGEFKGKRIAIIGPASSAFNTNNGSYIDNFDFVIRINKSALLVDSGKSAKDIGSRTDILFHCFFENMYSGGGPLDFDMYRRQKIRYVVNPRNTFDGWRTIFNFYKKYLKEETVYTLDRKFYASLQNSFGKFRPTTGFAALYAAMESDFLELYIAGFTFFKTAYGDGYRDEMKESKQAIQYIKDSQIHDPDLEYTQFRKLLAKHNGKNIITDPELTAILKSNT